MTNSLVFRVILAMDSYNRGYNDCLSRSLRGLQNVDCAMAPLPQVSEARASP